MNDKNFRMTMKSDDTLLLVTTSDQFVFNSLSQIMAIKIDATEYRELSLPSSCLFLAQDVDSRNLTSIMDLVRMQPSPLTTTRMFKRIQFNPVRSAYSKPTLATSFQDNSQICYKKPSIVKKKLEIPHQMYLVDPTSPTILLIPLDEYVSDCETRSFSSQMEFKQPE